MEQAICFELTAFTEEEGLNVRFDGELSLTGLDLLLAKLTELQTATHFGYTVASNRVEVTLTETLRGVYLEIFGGLNEESLETLMNVLDEQFDGN